MLAADPHALLRGGRPLVVAPLPAEEHVLELVHPGVGEQQRRVVGRDERRAGRDAVALRLEELQEGPADFSAASSHGSSGHSASIQPTAFGGDASRRRVALLGCRRSVGASSSGRCLERGSSGCRAGRRADGPKPWRRGGAVECARQSARLAAGARPGASGGRGPGGPASSRRCRRGSRGRPPWPRRARCRGACRSRSRRIGPRPLSRTAVRAKAPATRASSIARSAFRRATASSIASASQAAAGEALRGSASRSAPGGRASRGRGHRHPRR